MADSASPRTRESDLKFLYAIADGKPVGLACDEAGYSRRGVYRYRDEDENFREAWKDATLRAVEQLEVEADQRGRDGIQTPVYYRDEMVGKRVRYSDTLLLARLKALAPDRYGSRAGASTAENRRVAEQAPRECDIEAEVQRRLSETQRRILNWLRANEATAASIAADAPPLKSTSGG